MEDSVEVMVALDRVADDVMVDVSFALELLDTLLDTYDDGDGDLDVELELSLGVTPAGTVSAGKVGLDADVDRETDIEDVMDVTEELTTAVRASRALVAARLVDSALLEEPVPCRGTRT